MVQSDVLVKARSYVEDTHMAEAAATEEKKMAGFKRFHIQTMRCVVQACTQASAVDM